MKNATTTFRGSRSTSRVFRFSIDVLIAVRLFVRDDRHDDAYRHTYTTTLLLSVCIPSTRYDSIQYILLNIYKMSCETSGAT